MAVGDRAQFVLEDEILARGAHHRDPRHRHREHDVGAGEMRIVGSVGAAEGVADDHRHAGRAHVDDGVEELPAGLDDAALLLLGAGQEARRVLDEQERDVVEVAEADEACRLQRCIDVDLARGDGGVIGDEAGDPAAEATEGGHHVAGALGLDLEELAVVADLLDVERDVHRRVHAGGRVERSAEESVLVLGVAVDRIRARVERRVDAVVVGQITE